MAFLNSRTVSALALGAALLTAPVAAFAQDDMLDPIVVSSWAKTASAELNKQLERSTGYIPQGPRGAIEGTAAFVAKVSGNGDIVSLTRVRSARNGYLDKAARRAVEAMDLPATPNGRDTNVIVMIQFGSTVVPKSTQAAIMTAANAHLRATNQLAATVVTLAAGGR